MSIPIFINVRDRLTALRELVEWLEAAGQDRIILLDNDSTYEPLVDWLAEAVGPHKVIHIGENLGARSLWKLNMQPKDEPYIFTDPDLVPIEECPLDLVDRLAEVLAAYPLCPKVGPGLYLDDVPEDRPFLEWERSLVAPNRQLAPGIYNSLIDTTFALYRPVVPWGYEGIRLGFPYQMRHTSWYVSDLDDEQIHYLSRATPGADGSSWAAEVMRQSHNA